MTEAQINRGRQPDIVGVGIPRPKPSRPRQSHREVSLDRPVEWVDEPSFPGQLFRGKDFVRMERMETMTYNLSIPKDLESYNKRTSHAYSEKSNMLVIRDDIRYCEKTGGWMAILSVQIVKFRKLDLVKETGKINGI